MATGHGNGGWGLKVGAEEKWSELVNHLHPAKHLNHEYASSCLLLCDGK